jgi:signal transduction histidine kinase
MNKNSPNFWSDIVSALAMSQTMGNVSSVVTKAARELAHADGATFVLRDRDFCHYFDESAISDLWKGSKFPMDACISGWAMKHRQSVVIHDIYQDDRIPHDAYKPTFVRSLCMTPVLKENPIAAIGCYWKDTYVPTENEVTALQSLADVTAVSIEKVQLREKLVSELSQSSNLETKNSELELYIHSVAHDLKSPLMTLSLITELLGVYAENQEPSFKTSLTVADATIQKMTAQIEKILALYRMNHMAVAKTKVNITSLFMDLTKQMALQYPLPAASVEAPDEVYAFCDPVLIQIVLENLISNSFKYSKGDIPRAIHLTANRTDSETILGIEDNGVGFDQALAGVLFKPLTRLHDPNKYKGTGVGLASSAKIIAMHGGKMWAEGVPGEGAKFYFSLPAT